MRRRVLGGLLGCGAMAVLGCGGADDTANPVATPDAGDSGADLGVDVAFDAPADATSDATDDSVDGSDAHVDAGNPITFAVPPASCAYKCPITTCAELTTPYVCPSNGAWDAIPHATACAAWDGTFPTPGAGKCSASAPGGEAAKYAGPDPDHAGMRVLPDGRRIRAAGSEWIFDEADLGAGQTESVTLVPGTSFALTVDAGQGNHAVRVVDTAKIASGTNPVVSHVGFFGNEELNGVAVFSAPDRVYVGTSYGKVQALTLDTTTGALTRDDLRAITLPGSTDPGTGNAAPWYVSGGAVSPDNTRLLVSSAFEHKLLVYDVTAGAAGYGQSLGQLDLGQAEAYQVSFDPNDSSGHLAYVSLWEGKAVAEIDLSDATQPTVARKFVVDQAPEGVVFFDARWMGIASDLGDSIAIVDRTAGTVTKIPVDFVTTGGTSTPRTGLPGLEPSSLAFDASSNRLYATLAAINAVAAWQVDLTGSTPKLAPLGRVPTSWWPTGVAVQGDGSLVVSSLRGHGTGPTSTARSFDDDNADHLRGGVQLVPAPTAGDLTAGEAAVASYFAVGQQPGQPVITCSDGSTDGGDFPIPPTPTGGSKAIDHVVFIIRENKNFDGVLGDMPGVNGSAAGTLKATTAEMDTLWLNFRQIVREFATSDNYYTDAVYSTQGHVWDTYGRTSDADERTWGVDARAIPLGGVSSEAKPGEGSIFDWLGSNGVSYDLLGEVVGSPASVPTNQPNPIDVKYPGGPFQNILFNDLPKACYTAGRLRVLCNLHQFVYMTISNDHTGSESPSSPAPETYVAVNDEATAIIIDALSHSPTWKSTLAIITEDDPSQGGDHVDGHRTPIAFVSPWVKRGYVSRTHIDVASLHKLFAHVFGKPYRNFEIANAPLPLDLFTSTPDYTPYVQRTRQQPIACGTAASKAERELSELWDFSKEDEQPGLDAQVMRWMRGEHLRAVPAELKVKIAARNALLQRERAAEVLDGR